MNEDLIYIAAPYWHDDRVIRRARVGMSTAFAAVIASYDGFVYSPITYGQALEDAALHMLAPIGEPYWHAHSMGMLRFASVILILCLPGWEASKGIRNEMAWCNSHGMPFYFVAPVYNSRGEFEPGATVRSPACAEALSLKLPQIAIDAMKDQRL